jgi:hypothetical protein
MRERRRSSEASLSSPRSFLPAARRESIRWWLCGTIDLSARPFPGRATGHGESAQLEPVEEGEQTVLCLVAEPLGRRFGDPLEGLLLHGEVGLDVQVRRRRTGPQ